MTSEFHVRNGLLAAEAGDCVVPAVLLKVIHHLAHRTKSVAAIAPVPAPNLSLKKVVFCSSGPGNIFLVGGQPYPADTGCVLRPRSCRSISGRGRGGMATGQP